MTWQSRTDAQKTTVTVAVFTILFALGVAGVDYVFQLGLDNFFPTILIYTIMTDSVMKWYVVSSNRRTGKQSKILHRN